MTAGAAGGLAAGCHDDCWVAMTAGAVGGPAAAGLVAAGAGRSLDATCSGSDLVKSTTMSA